MVAAVVFAAPFRLVVRGYAHQLLLRAVAAGVAPAPPLVVPLVRVATRRE